MNRHLVNSHRFAARAGEWIKGIIQSPYSEEMARECARQAASEAFVIYPELRWRAL